MIECNLKTEYVTGDSMSSYFKIMEEHMDIFKMVMNDMNDIENSIKIKKKTEFKPTMKDTVKKDRVFKNQFKYTLKKK